MESYRRDAVEWAACVAARLKVLAANTSDDSPEVRQAGLGEALTAELKDVASSDRPAFLRALEARFPVLEASGVPAADVSESKDGSRRGEDTPEALLDRLLRAAEELEPRSKQELAERLTAAGFELGMNKSLSGELSPDSVTALGLRPSQPIPVDRLAALVSAMVEPLLSLDQLTHRVRQRLAAQPTGRERFAGSAELKEAIRQYLLGEPNAPIDRVALALRQGAKTSARLLHVLGGAGREFARKHSARFAPKEIKAVAELERGFEHIERKCWRVYVRSAEDFWTESAIENEIQNSIAARLRDFTSL